MHQIPFGLRITPNLDFIFILKNHNPLRIKHASSHKNWWRFSESLLLLQMWAGHNSHFILAEGACPGHPCFLWKEVISHSWSPFLIHSTKEWWRRTWKLSLEDLLLGQACACLKQFFWASSFHLWNGNNICQHWRCCSDKIWWRDEDTINMWHIHLFAFQSWVDLISCGIDLQQLEAGLQFWARDWGQAMIESWIPSL